MSIKVMTAVWERSKAKGSTLLLLLAIADHAHDDFSGAYPSVRTLAKKTRMSDRNVQNLIKDAVDLGELKVDYNSGKNGSNLYTIILGGAKFSPVKNEAVTGEKQSQEPVNHSSPEPSLEPLEEPDGASKIDAPIHDHESQETQAVKKRYQDAILEFNGREEHKANPKKEEKRYVSEVAPVLSRILGREGYVIDEDRVAAKKMFGRHIPLEYVQAQEAHYRNGGGEEFVKPNATAFWVANRYEKDYAISRIEEKRNGQSHYDQAAFAKKYADELRGYGLSESDVADVLREQGLASPAARAP